ncbi:hypothetical protein SAMN06298216_2032 [Spirosomataceae bacterium TFI 002]|nr:hypothetical protein SAMN06298216_2032 [Spirosomataceae bacterium TFI 002]
MIFDKYGLIIGGCLTIIGGIITLWYSHSSNLKNDKKTDETLEVSKQNNLEASKSNLLLDEANISLGKLKEENNGLRTQINNLQSENLQLHRELSIENKEILDNLTGGNSFPIIEFTYSTPSRNFEAIGKVMGDNNIIVQDIKVLNISGEKKFRAENQQPLGMNPDRGLHGKWNNGLNNSKYSFLSLRPKLLVAGYSTNLIDKYNFSELNKTDHKTSLEIEIVALNGRFTQQTDLLLARGTRGGGRWDDLITLRSKVTNSKGEVLYAFENDHPWFKNIQAIK